MPTEYLILATSALMLSFAWIPSHIAKYHSYGSKWLLGNRKTPKGELSDWGGRAERAYQNLKDYFPAFAVLVLILGALDKFSAVSTWFCASFLIMRIIHMASYIAGHVLARALSYMVSMICLVGLFVLILI